MTAAPPSHAQGRRRRIRNGQRTCTMVAVSAELSAGAHDGIRRAARPLAGLVVTAVCAIALTGCTPGDADNDATNPTDSTSSSVDSTRGSTTPPPVDERATAPGTKLKLAESAVVRFAANPKHDSLIKLTVTDVEQGKIKDLAQFRLDDETKRSNVYYVSATVKKVGKADLGGQPISLYGQVSEDLVVPPVVFGSTFKRCNYQPLPEKFDRGERADVCIVLLAPGHGEVTSVQWRAADNSDPIIWKVR